VTAAYVVLTHANWPQSERLAAAILRSSPQARVLIAHDDRREVFPRSVGDPRIAVYRHGLSSDWGSWELVRATLAAFDRARDLFDPDLVVLLSGADYPTRPLAAWEAEALAADGWVGTAEPLRYRTRWGRRRGDGDDRYTRYAFRWFRPPWHASAAAAPAWWLRIREALALRLEPVFGMRFVTRGRGLHYGFVRWPAPFGPGRPCYFGSQWLAVRRPELDRLLDEDFAAGSRLTSLYRRTVIPDESALVTALAWRQMPSTLAPVSHTRWDVASDTAVTFTAADLDDIVASGSPFCRKMDPARSGELMDLLDQRI
jgi:hypothetical protein